MRDFVEYIIKYFIDTISSLGYVDLEVAPCRLVAVCLFLYIVLCKETKTHGSNNAFPE